MPSLAHHALVDLFREHPALAPRLLELALGVRLPRGTSCRVTDSSLDRVRPLERRADLVLQLVRRGRPVLTIIVEVQRRRDDRKWLAWADYLLTARRSCRACVLVIAPSARVAAWADQPFDLGPGNEALRFWVLGPRQIEPVTDPEVAIRAPELAFLSALAHARTQPATLAAAVASLPTLSGNLAEMYYSVLSQHLPARLRPSLEAHAMQLQLDRSKYPETPFFRYLRQRAAEIEREIAHEKGLKEGLKEGLKGSRTRAHEERLAARRAILVRLMEKSGFVLSDAQRRKVERCAEVRQLDRWIDRVLTAGSSREVLASPRRAKASASAATKKPATSRRTRRA